MRPPLELPGFQTPSQTRRWGGRYGARLRMRRRTSRSLEVRAPPLRACCKPAANHGEAPHCYPMDPQERGEDRDGETGPQVPSRAVFVDPVPVGSWEPAIDARRTLDTNNDEPVLGRHQWR